MRTTIVAFCMGLVMVLAPDARADQPVTIRSPSELVGGIVTATLGGVTLNAGVAVLVVGAAYSQCPFCSSGANAVGLPLVIAGAIATIGGIWMALEGGRRTRPRWSLSPVGFAATF